MKTGVYVSNSIMNHIITNHIRRHISADDTWLIWYDSQTLETEFNWTDLGWYRNTCSKVLFKYSGRLEQIIRSTVSNPTLLLLAVSFKPGRGYFSLLVSVVPSVELIRAVSSSASGAFLWSILTGLKALPLDDFATILSWIAFVRKKVSPDSYDMSDEDKLWSSNQGPCIIFDSFLNHYAWMMCRNVSTASELQ